MNFPKGHVRFGLVDSGTRENSISIKENGPGCVHVQLGFLQFQHNYEITLDLPKHYFQGRDLKEILKATQKSPPHVNCKLISFEEENEHFHVIVEFCARKEKLIRENLVFEFDDKCVELVFIARVLGEGKGTPLLKNEIKCIGAEVDDMSDASDWAGFD